MTDFATVTRAVFDTERELGLLALESRGARPWERIRFEAHRAILVGAGLIDEPQWRLATGVAERARALARRSLDALRRSPWRARPADLLFVGHARRKKSADGTWWDLYCDPVLPKLKRSFVYAEEPDLGGHFTPARTADAYYLDGIWLASVAADRLAPSGLTRECAGALAEAEARLRERTGVSVRLRRMASAALKRRSAALPLYRRLLARLRPKLVVVVVSYGKETLVEAARERGIPVAELQHGVIHGHHLGYAYPSGTKRDFPDWLLTFGDYWRTAAPLPLPRERVVAVGYPYFEAESARHTGVPRRDQVLFLSQGAIGARLSRLAAAVAGRHPWRIVYKLHRAEYADWRARYPWLADGRVQVLDTDDVPLYRLFAESRAQVGVFSTAVYEGLGFGLPTFLAELPGIESMAELLASGSALRVRNAEELVCALGRARSAAPDVERFFRGDATRRLAATLERLAGPSSARSPALPEHAKDE